MKRGVYLVAYGEHARQCAHDLIRTIRDQMPGLPVCVAAERRLGDEDVLARSKQRDDGARWQKTRIWHLAPLEWEQVLYLDADILLVDSVEPIFRILDARWDLVMTTSPPKCPCIRDAQRATYRQENMLTDEELGGDKFPQLAGGVWAFQRNERTRAYLEAFHREWKRFGNRDQQAMDRALYTNPVRVWVLGREFNWFVHHERPTDATVVMHFATAAREWVHRHAGRQLWEEWRTRL